jgi:Zn-dependent peptidase ImmA (M78 family)
MTVLIEGNINKNFCQKAVQLFCAALSIDVPSIHIFTDETIRPNGACYRADENEFMIVLKERDEGQMMLTLAHEMVHVKQYLLDDLSNKFDDSIPYMERWWEQEAFEKEVVLTKMLIQAITEKKL